MTYGLTMNQLMILLNMDEEGMHIVHGDNGSLWLTAWHHDPDDDVRLNAADVEGLVNMELLEAGTLEMTDFCAEHFMPHMGAY